MTHESVEESLDGSQAAMYIDEKHEDSDEPHLPGTDLNSDLRLQLIDQRDAFLFEYEELENEVLELRALIDTMQHKIEETNRRWYVFLHIYHTVLFGASAEIAVPVSSHSQPLFDLLSNAYTL